MPQGKPAGMRCSQLTPDNRCSIHGLRERPAVCASFPALAEHCGSGPEEAMLRLAELEQMTASIRGEDGQP
jgi:Fe-S-cluster containining protein